MLSGSARRIVVVGSVSIDLMLRCPQVVAPGEYGVSLLLIQALRKTAARRAMGTRDTLQCGQAELLSFMSFPVMAAPVRQVKRSPFMPSPP